jgi:hypothetical protein
MAGSHAFFSPSSADRIVSCPASLLQTKDLPDTPSFEAVEGTVAHFIHEACLTQNVLASVFVGVRADVLLPTDHLSEAEWALIKDFVVTAEMAEYVQESVDYCRSLPGRHFIEQRLSIDPWTPIPGQFGTSDFIAADFEGRTLYCVDLKYGRGVKVYAENNAQLALYALGALHDLEPYGEFEHIVICVSQPRLDHRDEWRLEVRDLYAFGALIASRFTQALEPDAPFGPSEKACKFCKLKPTCPALYARALELAQGMFDNLEAEITTPDTERTWPLSAPAVKPLGPKHLAAVLANASLLRGFLDEVEGHATHTLMQGQDVPGYKLVEGRSNRKWKDLEAARALLEKHQVAFYHEPDPISPAEAEKNLPKAVRPELAPLVVKPAGKPTLAPVTDKRPVFTPTTAAEMFDAVQG